MVFFSSGHKIGQNGHFLFPSLNSTPHPLPIPSNTCLHGLCLSRYNSRKGVCNSLRTGGQTAKLTDDSLGPNHKLVQLTSKVKTCDPTINHTTFNILYVSVDELAWVMVSEAHRKLSKLFDEPKTISSAPTKKLSHTLAIHKLSPHYPHRLESLNGIYTNILPNPHRTIITFWRQKSTLKVGTEHHHPPPPPPPTFFPSRLKAQPS